MTPQPEEIDVRGLYCPLPVLKTAKRLKSMKKGDLIKMLVTDPAAVIDVPHFCNETGYRLVEQSEQDDLYIFVIEKTHDNL